MTSNSNGVGGTSGSSSSSNAPSQPSRHHAPSSSFTGGTGLTFGSSNAPPPSQLPRAGTSIGHHSSSANSVGNGSPRTAASSASSALSGSTGTSAPTTRPSATSISNVAAASGSNGSNGGSTAGGSARVPSSMPASAIRRTSALYPTSSSAQTSSSSTAPATNPSAAGPAVTAATQLSTQPPSSAGQTHSMFLPNYSSQQQQQQQQPSSSRGQPMNGFAGVPANSSLFGLPQPSYGSQTRTFPSVLSYQPLAAGNSSPRAALGGGHSSPARTNNGGPGAWPAGASSAGVGTGPGPAAAAAAAAAGGYGTPLPWMSGLPHSSSPANQTHTTQGYGWSLADPAGWSGWPSARKACSGFEENQMVSFTWTISDAHLLREEVEHSPLPSEGGRSVSAGAGKSEVWTTQPLFGDGKWKLELVRTSRAKPQESQDAGAEEGVAAGKKDQEDQDNNNEEGSEDKKVDSNSLTVLSIYLTSAQLDYAQADVEIPTAIMFGIRPARTQAGQDSSRGGPWLWRHFTRHVFKREEEYVECHSLPSISELLCDEAIAKQDAFAITVQIGTGPGTVLPLGLTPSSGLVSATQGEEGEEGEGTLPFVVKDKQLVPRSLMDGLEEMIDSAATGDVILIVRERGIVVRQAVDGDETASHIVPLPVGQPMPASALSSATAAANESVVETQDGEGPEVVVRDRVLWAHSSILCSRSEFFRDMLGSHFLEGQSQTLHGGEHAPADAMPTSATSTWHEQFGRRFKALRIPDADFTAAYWLLRYLYLEEVEFMEHEDVRSTLDEEWMILGSDHGDERGSEAGTTTRRPLWEWRTINDIRHGAARQDQAIQVGGGHELGAHSGASGLYAGPRSVSSRHSLHSMSSTASGTETAVGTGGPASPTMTTTTPTGRRSAGGSCHDVSPYPRRPGEWDPRNRASVSESLPFAETRTELRPDHGDSLGDALRRDPHPHPAKRASPASALGLYRLAHRYGQRGLCSLAKQHLVASLTPQSCFSILLATHLYADLHEPVKAYVLENWHLVCTTAEFERCCDEVSGGEWGSDAGRALRVFMRSLVSPSSTSAAASATSAVTFSAGATANSAAGLPFSSSSSFRGR